MGEDGLVVESLLSVVKLKRSKLNVLLAMQNIALCELSRKLPPFAFFDRRQRIWCRFVPANPSQTGLGTSSEAGLLVNKSARSGVHKVAPSLTAPWTSLYLEGKELQACSSQSSTRGTLPLRMETFSASAEWDL